MVALRDNNDNNKRKKKERRTGKDTEEKRRNVAFKELKERPPLSAWMGGTGSRHGYCVFTELKTLGPHLERRRRGKKE